MESNVTLVRPSNVPKVIDIQGPLGNAFYILGVAEAICKNNDLNWDGIKTEMISSDYENLCKTFIKHFGSIVELKNTWF